MPAVTPSAPLSPVSALDLAHRNILWTSITSCSVSLPLPLDSCCSVSLVSQNHAELVAKASPTLLFTKLVPPIPVSVAGPSFDLRAVGTMQVPNVWENGRLTTFTMLFVPQFSPTGDFLCSFYSNPSLFSSSGQHSFSVSFSNLLCHAGFLSTGSPSSTNDLASGRLFTTNILIHSEKGTAYLPHDMAFCPIRSQTPDDLMTYNDASTYTAHHLAESWHSFLLLEGPVSFPTAFASVVSMPTDASIAHSSRILIKGMSTKCCELDAMPTNILKMTSS